MPIDGSLPYTFDNPDAGDQNIPILIVEGTTITSTDMLAQIKVRADDTGIYDDYEIKNRYEKDYHRYMMSVTSPSQMTQQCISVVQLGVPTLLWIADWTGKRVGGQPKLPEPSPQIENWVLLDEHYEPAMLKLAADGVSAEYQISGTFVYACLCPNSRTIRDICFPRAPWIKDTFDRSIKEEVMETEIINILPNEVILPPPIPPIPPIPPEL
jgi:hypothetical protein